MRVRGEEGGAGGAHTFQGCTWLDKEEWKRRRRRRSGVEVWAGVSEDMGLEGGLYSQGNVANISLEGQGLSNRISEKGRCESDPMVDKKKREWPLYSIRAPVVRQCVPFVFFGICGTPPCAKSEAKLSAIHIRSPVRKNITCSGFSSLSFFAPFLCNSAANSVAQDGTLPPQPCPTSFPSSVPRARALWPLMSSTPTTRSRTLLFLSYRDSRASTSTSHHRYVPDTDADENERLIDPAKDHIAIDVGLPPKWSAAREDNHLTDPSLTFEPLGWIFRTE